MEQPYRFGRAPTPDEPPLPGYSRAGTVGMIAVAILGLSVGALWVGYVIDFIELGEIAAHGIPPWLPRTISKLSTVSWVTHLVGLAAFCVWLHRAVKNTRAIGRPMTITPGWAVAWALIPIANLFMTYKTMKALLASSDPRETVAVPPTLSTWWLLVLAGNAIRIFTRVRMHTRDMAFFRLEVVASLALTGSLVALAWLILDIHRGQEALKQRARQV